MIDTDKHFDMSDTLNIVVPHQCWRMHATSRLLFDETRFLVDQRYLSMTPRFPGAQVGILGLFGSRPSEKGQRSSFFSRLQKGQFPWENNICPIHFAGWLGR